MDQYLAPGTRKARLRAEDLSGASRRPRRRPSTLRAGTGELEKAVKRPPLTRGSTAHISAREKTEDSRCGGRDHMMSKPAEDGRSSARLHGFGRRCGVRRDDEAPGRRCRARPRPDGDDGPGTIARRSQHQGGALDIGVRSRKLRTWDQSHEEEKRMRCPSIWFVCPCSSARSESHEVSEPPPTG